MAIALTLPARADDQSIASAQQITGLFMQSCIQFGADKAALRGWAKQNNLQEVPAEGRDAFLHGLPGIVFDASNAVGKFVLISDDGGGCTVVAERADGPAVQRDFEDDMRRAGIAVTAGRETPNPPLLMRDYTASIGGRAWRIVVGTVRDQQGGQAMLSAATD